MRTAVFHLETKLHISSMNSRNAMRIVFQRTENRQQKHPEDISFRRHFLFASVEIIVKEMGYERGLKTGLLTSVERRVHVVRAGGIW